ncbi:MAG: SDR family oxidoreductase [Bradyrhizobium sp.]|nr:SDR family oxidoreductase [Bradyrhizobium sp.]
MSILDRFSLTGRRALVTGASMGIGLASARALAEAGAQVTLTARNEARLKAATEQLEAEGLAVAYRSMDVTSTASVDSVAATIGPVDILVANAGIAQPGAPSETVGDEVMVRVFDVNVGGVARTIRAFAAGMLERGRGSIVTIGSISGVISNRPQDQCYYNASKAAVHHLTRSLAAEWARRGVRVNAVAPGYIATPMNVAMLGDHPELASTWLAMTPMGRLGEPDEIAGVVLFLASDAASYMTGSVVLADGGYVAW